MEKYQTIIIKNIDTAFINQWKELWEKAENTTIFNSYEWFLSSLDTCKITEYEIYACYKNHDLVAILPLFITKRFGIKIAQPIGYKFVSTPFLVARYEEELFRYFFGQIAKHHNLYIPKIDLKGVKMLHDIFPQMFFSLISVNPYIDRRDNPYGFTSGKSNSEVRRIIRNNTGDLSFAVYDNKSDLISLLELMFDIEQKSAKKLRKKDLFSKIENKEYFINIVKHCSNFVQIAFVYYKNIPIAYDFIFKEKEKILGYQCAYLSEFRHLSPGIILGIKELESLENSQFKIFDFGGGISSYKQRFTTTYYLLYDLWFSKNILIMIWWKFINSLRRVNQILFPIKYTRDHEFLFKSFS